MKRAVTYYRVSTKRQGKSGLGLDAQREAVEDFLAHNAYLMDSEFIEIESGKNNKRPVLQQALKACKENNATLVIAKLDRLSRSVAFISTLMESTVEFIAVDYPDVEDIVLHILAAVAQRERLDISKRTIAALKAAKARGVELGKYGKYVLSQQNKHKAQEFAERMKPVIEHMREREIITIRGITKELNRQKVPTYSNAGCKWHPTTVYNLLKRLREHENK